MRTSTRLVLILAFLAGIGLVCAGAWVSLRNDAQATRESGVGLGLPSLSPTPSGTPFGPPAPPTSQTPTMTPSVTPSEPLRLVVSRVGIDAEVQWLGITDDDTQQVPDNFTDVGWWKDGQLPGELGNAVFTGHTYSKGSGVFDRLPELRQGDVIEVRAHESEYRYTVSSVGSVTPKQYDDVKHDIYRTTGPSGLVLMTCGDWDGSAYKATTVVYAELIS